MSMRHFVYGGLAGVVVGLLIAPKSGKVTRQDLRVTYFEMKDRIIQDLAKIKKISKETYESVVNSVVGGYEEARLITAREAAQIRAELRLGYERIRTVFEAPEKD